MYSNDKLFGNLFFGSGITKLRFLVFCKDILRRLKAGNPLGKFDTVIAKLTLLIPLLEADLGNVDVKAIARTGDTKTVDEIVADFTDTMSVYHGVIAHLLGGKDTKEFLSFYPQGLVEYHKPSRENMIIFANRIHVAATDNSTKLGVDITAKLQSFKPDFAAARDLQGDATTDVSTGKGSASNNCTNLELAATEAVHLVGTTFPGDVVKGGSYFNFNLLYATGHHHHEVLSGDVAAAGTVVLENKTYSDNFVFELRNKGTNSAWWIWLGANATDGDDSMAIKVEPGKSVIIKPSDIGVLTKTFLMLKNDSGVNAGSYEITIIG